MGVLRSLLLVPHLAKAVAPAGQVQVGNTPQAGYLSQVTAAFVKAFARREAPGTTDCAEFTYHNSDGDCTSLCESISNVDVRSNCKCYKGVGVPMNLKKTCGEGYSVMRCKICDRAMNFDEQDFVHDEGGYFPYNVVKSDGMRATMSWLGYFAGWGVFIGFFGALIYYVRK
eukprot:g8764.t1